MQMAKEMQKRIEERLKSDETEFKHGVWPETKEGLRVRDADFAALGFRGGFQAGAKFILEMPELRSALEFFAANYLDGCKCSNEITCYLCRDYESLKKAGLCE